MVRIGIIGSEGRMGQALARAVTDGGHVWVITGLGDLHCFDFEGNQVWERNISEDYWAFGLAFGYASSPVLYDGRLYIQVLHGMKTDDPSYLLAVNAATGKTIWKVERPTDAISESPDSYSTPMLVEVRGKKNLVIAGGDYVTGHDLDTVTLFVTSLVVFRALLAGLPARDAGAYPFVVHASRSLSASQPRSARSRSACGRLPISAAAPV